MIRLTFTATVVLMIVARSLLKKIRVSLRYMLANVARPVLRERYEASRANGWPPSFGAQSPNYARPSRSYLERETSTTLRIKVAKANIAMMAMHTSANVTCSVSFVVRSNAPP